MPLIKAIVIDQSPIGHLPNPATHTGVSMYSGGIYANQPKPGLQTGTVFNVKGKADVVLVVVE